MSNTHSPVLVRMRNELKADLQRQATRNGRTLTGEIVRRLEDSLKAAAPNQPYPTNVHNLVVHTKESGPGEAISETDQAMLQVFHALPVEKQLALLSLFK